ncbi:MAG: beta-propeller fold lactonase family protein [Crocinitomicaceae bacterium]|nr:beta-propeller fold lactonase family protein [Crocinitomicaceae bacterium]
MIRSFLLLFLLFQLLCVEAQITRIKIGKSSDTTGEVVMALAHRFQSYNWTPKHKFDNYDTSINSPKSVKYSKDGTKFYVQSLEGYTTSIYDSKSKSLIKTLIHEFTVANDSLFKDGETTIYNYPFKQNRKQKNVFLGKPVESCFSHGGKYLWVTYYRRDFDPIAQSPSAVAIIDTESDIIVRVMPTGPLPKMIACSPDNKRIAITHWGDNTVAIVDIDSDDPFDFNFVKHSVVDYKMSTEFSSSHVNRDASCGFCLRGTAYTPDGQFLLVGRMGGGGIAIFDAVNYDYLGTVFGMMSNVRHLVVKDDYLYISCNRPGYVQRCNWRELVKTRLDSQEKKVNYSAFENVYVGTGARTIVLTSDGKYLYAAANSVSKIVAVRTSDMKVVAKIPADSYPVGMAISSDNSELIVTSQGKSNRGGNSVMVFSLTYK